MSEPEPIQPLKAPPGGVVPLAPRGSTHNWGFHVAIVGLSTSLALLAATFLQQGIDAFIYGPPPEGVISGADRFEQLCIGLLLLLNPPLPPLMLLTEVLFAAWLPPSVANALFLIVLPAWWGLLAWLMARRSEPASR